MLIDSLIEVFAVVVDVEERLPSVDGSDACTAVTEHDLVAFVDQVSPHVNIFDSKVCHLFILVTQTRTVSVRYSVKGLCRLQEKIKSKNKKLGVENLKVNSPAEI